MPFILVALLIVSLGLVIRRRYLIANLSHIPGPVTRSISVLPRLISVYRGQSHRDDGELHRQYGNFVRLAPHLVSVSDPSLVDQLYGISTDFFKSGFYEPLRFYDEAGLIPDPFILSDKKAHSRMKRNAANAYSLQSLREMEPLVDATLQRLFRQLDHVMVDSNAVDLGEYLHRFALDTIFSVTFGRDLGFMEKGDRKGVCQRLADGLFYFVMVGQIPWAHKYLLGSNLFQKVLAWATGDDPLVTEIMGIAISQRAVVMGGGDERMNSSAEGDEKTISSPRTFLARLLEGQKKNPASITDREIDSHTFGNITAGSDTTSTALRAIVRNLVNHESVRRGILDELDAHHVTTTGGDGAAVSFQVASSLPFLQAVIKESLRLHSPVGMLLARGVPSQGTTTLVDSGTGKKYDIGPGAEVGINPWILHRDPQTFSPDPSTFRPERWLTSSPEQLRLMNRAYLAFGAGRHTCSGQHISVLEMTKLIPSLVLRYEMDWAKGGDGDRGVSVLNRFFTMQKGLLLELKHRRERGALSEL